MSGYEGSITRQMASKMAQSVTEPVVVEPKQGGVKFDGEKVDFSLLSPTALEEISKVLTFGKKKYARDSWRGGILWSRYFGAILRHIFAYMGGQDKDPETGLSHLAHAACCIMFLLEFEKTHPELDDRYKGVKNEQA